MGISGPENGKTITCQLAGQGRGSLAAHEDCSVHSDTTYENWANNEPNDWPGTENPSQEDYLHLKKGDGNGMTSQMIIQTLIITSLNMEECQEKLQQLQRKSILQLSLLKHLGALIMSLMMRN